MSTPFIFRVIVAKNAVTLDGQRKSLVVIQSDESFYAPKYGAYSSHEKALQVGRSISEKGFDYIPFVQYFGVPEFMIQKIGTITPSGRLIPARRSKLTEFPFPNSTAVEIPTLSHEGLVFALEGLLKEFQTRASLPCNKHSHEMRLALDAFESAYCLIKNQAGIAVDILRHLKSKVNHNATSIQISLLILALKGKIPPDSGWIVNDNGFLTLS